MAYKSKYTGAEIEAKLDVVYNNYFNPVVPDEPIVPDEPEPLPLGVFIQHTSGWLFTADEWTAKGFPNEEANGVAVSTEECAFVIAKDNVSTAMMWSSDTENAVDGIVLTSGSAEAKKDYNGKANTQLMLATDTSGAGYSCSNFAFPNEQKGYLPAFGEWYIAYYNRSAIDAAMTLIGGAELGSKYYWSSTQTSATEAWNIGWRYGNWSDRYKRINYYVRPFTTLKPEDIPSVEPTPPEKPEETPLGVFIQHVDGSLYTADEWTAKGFASADANGVAVSAEECKFVMAKTHIIECKWSDNTNTLIDGVLATEDKALAKNDYNGESNTALIVATDTTQAAYRCFSYAFPNGKKGYLPAAGELCVAYLNRNAIYEAYTKIGASSPFVRAYWSSTQYNSENAYRVNLDADKVSVSGKSGYSASLPFTTL